MISIGDLKGIKMMRMGLSKIMTQEKIIVAKTETIDSYYRKSTYGLRTAINELSKMAVNLLKGKTSL